MKTSPSLSFSLLSKLILISLLVFLNCKTTDKPTFTRGVGIYPGAENENAAPSLTTDNDNYRNLALLRPAFHSGSYDYNLTAQLITDGMITDKKPAYIALSTSDGLVSKNETEWIYDHGPFSSKTSKGNSVWMQLALRGPDAPADITQIKLYGEFKYDPAQPKPWTFSLKGSDDGQNWETLNEAKGTGLAGLERQAHFPEMNIVKKLPSEKPFDPIAGYYGPVEPDEPKPSFGAVPNAPQPPTRALKEIFTLKNPVSFSFYKIELNTSNVLSWTISELEFYNRDKQIEIAPGRNFTSAWMSSGTQKEWVYVDLGSVSTFDQIKLYWISKATAGTIQVSDDAVIWKDVIKLPGTENLLDEIKLPKATSGKYVRVLMTGGTEDRYILSEIEIMGKGGMIPVAKPSPPPTGNRLYLTGGGWKINRASQVDGNGEQVSTIGFTNNGWIVATVPGTALTSYLNAGALPDPNYSDNQLMISDSYFNSDFWYRNEFEVPSNFLKERLFLNFDGINWKADIYLNGKRIGDIRGAFTGSRFDVTDLIISDKRNVLAVLIHKNDHPGNVTEQTLQTPNTNGGILGADNPTMHASIGWDWIPTIRGRNIGIWNDVYLTSNGDVTIDDPFVTTNLPLPDTTVADVTIEVALTNHTDKEVSGKLTGNYGEISFEQLVIIPSLQSKVIRLNPETIPGLHITNPKLWWPKGYGAPSLYDVRLTFKNSEGVTSDHREFKSGIREMSFTEKDYILNMYINGRRFIGRGGNWGFPESNLNYRAREYDIAVRYHADMNFTMIRNWVGQTGDDEFYEACDRHGIMVWQDFWLANPYDGPDPDDPTMFMDNANAMIKRIRNHPSIGLYVGRNEGNPPQILDNALAASIEKLHPDLHFISHSSVGVVTGGGPYRALPVKDYFLLFGRHKFHSERGMPNVMTYESMLRMLPESRLWPQNDQWGLHDYCLEGAQGAASFNKIIETAFGPVNNARKFTELAQWINYDGYRGMFEGRSKFRQGLLLWMSHSAWPSMVWQTYDYYFEPTAAYFACKKASEPIHIQWNPVWDEVEVVNYSAKNLAGLTANAKVINMDGKVIWEKDTVLNSNEDTTVKLFRLQFPEELSDTHFIKLVLKKDNQIVSDNFYWRGKETGNFTALNQLPQVEVQSTTSVQREGDEWILKTTVSNKSTVPALMIRLNVLNPKSGKQILPVIYSDNYLSLMPGESKSINISVKNEDSFGHEPTVVVSGFNLK
jgi:Fe-S cluster assembly scaffold protein SufB